MKYDVIIVGQGLAGTVLALSLLEKNKSVLIISDSKYSSSSIIAPGNINPAVFKRLVPTWQWHTAYPKAKTFYQNQEKTLNASFFWEKKMMKFFTEQQEIDLWKKKCLSAENNFLLPEINYNYLSNYFFSENGCAAVSPCANLFVSHFLENAKNYFKEKNIFIEELFDEKLLQHYKSTVSYKSYESSSLVLCRGWLESKGKLFNFIPFKPAKGEILIVKIKGLNTDFLHHKGITLLPIGDDLFIAGSTYNWNDLDENNSDEAREEISSKLKKMIRLPFEIIEQQAGVRPAVADRRPVIGSHPVLKNVFVFNGLGTKGVLLSPFIAEQLYELMYNNVVPDKEVNSLRFSHLFSSNLNPLP